MTALAVLFATVGGAGRSPFAPGTVGSAVGVVVFLLIQDLPAAGQLAIVAAITIVGVPASTVTARHFGRKDPGQVVVDEVAGQLVTLVLTGVTMPGVVIGFLVFRLLDITKPWPARQFEAFRGGTGIMADDVMAGLYGNAILQVAVRALPGWL